MCKTRWTQRRLLLIRGNVILIWIQFSCHCWSMEAKKETLAETITHHPSTCWRPSRAVKHIVSHMSVSPLSPLMFPGTFLFFSPQNLTRTGGSYLSHPSGPPSWKGGRAAASPASSTQTWPASAGGGRRFRPSSPISEPSMMEIGLQCLSAPQQVSVVVYLHSALAELRLFRMLPLPYSINICIKKSHSFTWSANI